MSKPTLYSFKEAAEMFGVSRFTVSDLARTLGIETKAMVNNGKAKGLNETDMRKLRKAMGIPCRAAANAN